MLEVDALFLAGTAQHKERKYGKHDSDPLIQVQAFSEYQHGTYKGHHRTGSINRPHDSKRKMLHTEIPECP